MGEAGEHSYPVRGAKGDYRWFLTRFEPLRASDGTLLLRIGVALDIDELTRAQGVLRESERSTVHPEELPRILELVKKGIASEIPFNFELRVRCFDGEYRRFENRHVPILDHSGRIARWYFLLTDIGDRTRALARFDQMQSDFVRMNRVSVMGELVASLSHEITQPIASTRIYARSPEFSEHAAAGP
jgi:PAS domain-containing protein